VGEIHRPARNLADPEPRCRTPQPRGGRGNVDLEPIVDLHEGPASEAEVPFQAENFSVESRLLLRLRELESLIVEPRQGEEIPAQL